MNFITTLPGMEEAIVTKVEKTIIFILKCL
jgi:hypothetical protein